MENKKEQQDIIDFSEGKILVSASAGSGKTYVMVERLLRLIIEKKAGLSDILAVTFTELSAEEMKQKIRDRLSEKILQGEKWLIKELNEVGTANISTIHAFCMNIIRTYFFYAENISPDFKILDEPQSERLKNKCIDKTFSYFYKENDSDFLDLLSVLVKNRKDNSFREYIVNLFNYISVEGNVEEYLSKILLIYNEQTFNGILCDLKNDFNKKISKYYDILTELSMMAKDIQFQNGCQTIENFYNTLKAIVSENDVYKAKDYIFPRANYGNKLCDEYEEIHKEIDKVFSKIKRAISEFFSLFTDRENDYQIFLANKETEKKIIKVINKFSEIYSEEKRKENVLDFSDLEHFALKILQEKEVREEIKGKFKYIFVDEYQDVNGVQEEIFSKIQNDNIFMVGDLKQSIYGFRGCRPEFFAEKQKTLERNNEKTEKLNYNFRCAKKVVDMVNSIFSYSMTEDSFGLNYAKDGNLVLGGVYDDAHLGNAEIHLIEKVKLDKKNVASEEIEALTPQENEQIEIYDILKDYNNSEQEVPKDALVIAQIIQGELGKKYYDFKQKKEVEITYNDIVILSRSLTNEKMEKVVKTLNNMGVPISTSMEQNVCDYSEVQVLINLLRLIDCFEQDIALASVLISPFGRFTEENLIEVIKFANDNNFSQENSSHRDYFFHQAFNYFIENSKCETAQKMLAFKNYFNNIRMLSDFVGAYEILQRLINESGYLDCVYASAFGEEKVKRIRNFMSKAKSGDKYLTVTEFLSLIDNSKKTFKFSTVADENAVKLMTIHASKGLEFPVVIFVGADKKFNEQDDKKEIFADRDFGFAFKTYNFESRVASNNILRSEILLRQQNNRVKEEMRLFYVALTRAKYNLHIISNGEPLSTDKQFITAKRYVDFMPCYLPVTLHKQDELQFLSEHQNTFDTISIIEGEADKEIAKNLSFKYAFSEDIILPVKSSVTRILEEKKDYNITKDFFDDSEEKSDSERGIIAHKILQYYDFFSGEPFEKQVSKMVENEILSSEKIGLVNMESLKKVVSLGIFNGYKGKKLYREKPFISNIPAKMLFNNNSEENVVIQGFIDLLVIGENGAEIVDYKYSSKGEKEIKEKYSLQLNVYAKAVENSLGIKVVSKKVVALLSNQIVEI